MRRRALVAAAATAVALSGGGLAAASGCPQLAGPWCGERAATPAISAHGPVRLDGTTASAVFRIGRRTIRQFRYTDRHELGYTFVLANHRHQPVTVVGVRRAGHTATLLRVDRLERAGTSSTRFTVPAGGARTVHLVLDMTACEHVSSRAGSFLSAVTVTVRGRSNAGATADMVRLPEELHTGSPREAFCPRATSTSRAPG
jgi:hypothetical protein